MIRTYECRNPACPAFAEPVRVRGRMLGTTFWEFPNVVCECGWAPKATEPLVIDSGDAPSELPTVTEGATF